MARPTAVGRSGCLLSARAISPAAAADAVEGADEADHGAEQTEQGRHQRHGGERRQEALEPPQLEQLGVLERLLDRRPRARRT